MDNLDFSEEEIQEQLAILGYKNIPKHTLREFKRDLDELILPEISKSLASSSELNATPPQPSPPAYTNEKVNQYYIAAPDNGHILDAGKPSHVRQVLTFCQNRGYRTRQEQHSVTSKLPLSPESPTRLEVELEPEDTRHSPYTDSHTSTPDRGTHGRHFIKRKVLRKHKGQFLVCDESVHSESDAASGLEERLAGLHVSLSTQHDSETENEDVTSQSDDHSSEHDGISFSAFESYIRAMTQTHDLRPRPKSFIRPAPVTTVKKSDPVTKYFQYKREWDRFKVPGEKDRRPLRREIRERLANQPPPPKPQRVYVPNTYVVPTEKKRSALRWQVKNDLANGLMPSRLDYQF